MKTVLLSRRQQQNLTHEVSLSLDGGAGPAVHALNSVFRQLTGTDHGKYLRAYPTRALQFKQPDEQPDGSLRLHLTPEQETAVAVELNISLRKLEGCAADDMNAVFKALSGRDHDVYVQRCASPVVDARPEGTELQSSKPRLLPAFVHNLLTKHGNRSHP